ncbi:MAG: polysaccharide deacetylase family protein [Flavobacteriales bacterium]|nr:polysaccharide deacetylase family protein [Flavobacteriales bacterium]
MKIYALNIALLLLCVLAYTFVQAPGKWYLITAFVALYLLFLFFAVKNVQLRFFVPYVNHTRQGVLLTFDDGPVTGKTVETAQILSRHNVHGLFFLIGERAQSHPDLVQKLVELGHAVGNHSYSHPNRFSIMRTDEVTQEIQKGEEVIRSLCHQEIVPFRVPFGLTNPRIGRAVRRLRVLNIGWNRRTFDTMRSPDAVLQLLKNRLRPRDIVLLHDSSAFCAEKLDAFLQWAGQQNIKFEDPHAFLQEHHS